MSKELLIVTAVEAEAKAIGRHEEAVVVASGIGRTNAACMTTEMILKRGPFTAVISAGVAGALPGSGLKIGEAVVASSCVYVEEGMATPDGVVGMESIGFALGDFEGNAAPVDDHLLDVLSQRFRIGPIATVATCSGTDAAAKSVARRTDALAEAMEGAAVVHAARRLRTPAIEVRTISNDTGDRSRQMWDLNAGLEALRRTVREVIETLCS